jgi:hypothetical protein
MRSLGCLVGLLLSATGFSACAFADIVVEEHSGYECGVDYEVSQDSIIRVLSHATSVANMTSTATIARPAGRPTFSRSRRRQAWERLCSR